MLISDSEDDLWDCSSNEGGEFLSDSDTSEENDSEVRESDAHKKFLLVSKAERAFSEMLTRLTKQIPQKPTKAIISSNPTKDNGTCLMNSAQIRNTICISTV